MVHLKKRKRYDCLNEKKNWILLITITTTETLTHFDSIKYTIFVHCQHVNVYTKVLKILRIVRFYFYSYFLFLFFSFFRYLLSLPQFVWCSSCTWEWKCIKFLCIYFYEQRFLCEGGRRFSNKIFVVFYSHSI